MPDVAISGSMMEIPTVAALPRNDNGIGGVALICIDFCVDLLYNSEKPT